MAKFKKQVTEENQVAQEEVAETPKVKTELSNLALGLHKDSNGRYFVDKIKYDPKTGEGKLVESVPTGSEHQDEADLRIHVLMQDLNWD